MSDMRSIVDVINRRREVKRFGFGANWGILSFGWLGTNHGIKDQALGQIELFGDL